MNDERFLKDWLRDTTGDTPDPQASADRVLARVPETKQRSRWWPWLPGRRRSHDDTPPSPQGRTRLMLSPVKAITAGALVLALSAAFLVTQPFERLGGGIPGAEETADPVAPVYVHTIGAAGVFCDEDSGSFEEDGPVEWSFGVTCKVSNLWSDPRLEGTETYVVNGIDYVEDASELYVGSYVHNIVTDEGAWRMRPQFRFDSADGLGGDGPGSFSGTWILDGEDAYEGLSVILAKDDESLSGFIVSTDLLPTAPEEGSTK